MASKSIVFVDSRVANYQSLIDSLTEPYEVFILDGDKDGLDQMAGSLKGRTGIDAIHVISHGSQGALYLGGTVLDSGNLDAYGLQLTSIGSTLSPTGDLLLYGCNVAHGDVGMQFVNQLALITGADVAASEGATGGAALGGDGVLEVQQGMVSARELMLRALDGLLAANTAPTFSLNGGVVKTQVGTSAGARSVAVQTDGRIVVGGVSDYDVSVVRYNVDGSLDNSFSNDGVVTTNIAGRTDSTDWVNGMALQTDGKIVVAGYSVTSGFPDYYLTMVRYTKDGNVDTSFNESGIVELYGGSKNFFGKCIVLQSDGKILIAGSANIVDRYTSGYGTLIVRFNTDGSLDSSFGYNGICIDDSTRGASGIALQADGKIIIVGANNNDLQSDLCIARYNINGTLDLSFSENGIASTIIGNNSSGNSVQVQQDGKIVVAGSSSNSTTSLDYALVRYNSDGSLDLSFSEDGLLTTDFSSLQDEARSLVIQADGKILLTGETSYADNYSSSEPNVTLSTNTDFSLVRYESDGRLDVSFGDNGKVVTNLGHYLDNGYGVVQQKDGRILVAGASGIQNPPAVGGYSTDLRLFALVRYLPNGEPDTEFGASLPVRPANASEQQTIFLSRTIKIVDTELSANGSYPGATLTLSRHGGASSQDVFSDSYGDTLSTLTQGAYFSVNNITIGRVTTNSAGVLTLSFNGNATQSLLNKALQNIAYTNTSDAPPLGVQIDWIFNDGNIGAQGTGGALSVTGSTTVSITAVNDGPPRLSIAVPDRTVTVGQKFDLALPSGAFTDPDGEALVYGMSMADGTALPPWLSMEPSNGSLSGIPDALDVGTWSLSITVKDAINGTASDTFSLSVSATPKADITAPTASSFSPTDEAVGIAIASDIVVTFNEAIVKGTGNIVVKTAAGVTVATYDAANSTNLSISGNTLTINPTSDLAYSTGYKVEFAAGSIKDLAGNAYAGTTSYNFATVADTTNQTFTGTAAAESFISRPGNDTIDGGAGIDTAIFNGNLANYTLSKSGNTYTVRTNTGTDGTDTLTNVESLKFTDLSVNLQVQGIAAAAPLADVQRISELYVAFFNRTPDADGMAYWIGQFAAGQTIAQISESFYSIGASPTFASLTGFSTSMTNENFIDVFYKNVLGRTEGADAGGLSYWNGKLSSGESTRSSLANDILDSAHSFKGNPTWGWVADLLDNKIAVANKIAIEWGLTYNTNAYEQGVNIAGAITPTDMTVALGLVGIADADLNLG